MLHLDENVYKKQLHIDSCIENDIYLLKQQFNKSRSKKMAKLKKSELNLIIYIK